MRDELTEARVEIDRLRRERDDAIRQRDRAVAALHEAGHADAEGFAEHIVVPRWRPLDYPPISVQIDASDDELDQMCLRVAGQWSAMGEQEPFFTVVAHDRYTMANIAEAGRRDELIGTGIQTLLQIESIARRHGVDIDGYRDCVELGCGIGRLSAALADAFGKVYALDISPGHLRVAREMLAATLDRVELRQLDGLASLEGLPPSDVFVSFEVLQHNPPPLAVRLLDMMLTLVRAGGVACFQCQTYQAGYRFTVAEYLRDDAGPGWEMHCIPQPVVYDLLRRNGFALREVRENASQADGLSQVFFAIREHES